ncbi:MAG: protein BatD [Chloroflexi bacterium]|nr:protein BatD [Chloroflexota bacterium]
MKRKLTIILISILTLAILVVPALAQQNDVITAAVDRNNVTTDDTILLTVTVQGTKSQPELPVLNGLNVVGSSQSTQISIVNGNMNSQAVYQFHLQPTQTGILTIDPVALNVNGQTFTSQPIQVQVTQGQGPSQSVQSLGQPDDPTPAPTTLNGQDLFVEAVVDNESPYQGEQVTYTFRFYQAVNLRGQPSYQPPDFSGLWNDVEPQQRQSSVTAASRSYHVTEIDSILFPTVAGEVIIDPTKLVIPGGLWSQDTTLQTQPIILDVRPLPAGAPLTFKGAVGKFALNTAVDKQETKVGEPITLNVEISGQGNIGTMGDPIWPDDVNWRGFDNDSGTYTELINGRLRGAKSYERLLIPKNGGQIALPGLEYAYFDPESETYETLTTEPVAVNVSGTAVSYTPEQPGTPPQENGLRHIKAVSSVADAGRPLVDQPWYWLLWLIPVGLVAGQIGYEKRQSYLTTTAGQRRNSQAAKKATNALKQTASSNDPYAETARILTVYLEEKLGTAVRGMTRQGRTDLLKERGVSNRTIANVEICLAQAEMGRYAPTGTEAKEAAELLEQAEHVIGKLEQYL